MRARCIPYLPFPNPLDSFLRCKLQFNALLAAKPRTFPRGEGGRAPARSEEEWRCSKESIAPRKDAEMLCFVPILQLAFHIRHIAVPLPPPPGAPSPRGKVWCCALPNSAINYNLHGSIESSAVRRAANLMIVIAGGNHSASKPNGMTISDQVRHA